MSEQLTHSANRFQGQKFPLVLVLDDIASPANLGSLFRLAEAFGVQQLYICGPEINLQSTRMKRTARATEERVKFEHWDTPVATCEQLKRNGYTLFCLEITDDSVPIDESSFGDFSKVALIVGNERSGIGKEVLQLSDHRIHITMFGENSSMNVAQSAGIALYEITKSLPPVQEK